ADAPVAAEACFLEPDRPQRQQHPVPPRHDEEQQRERHVDDAVGEPDDRDDVAQQLHERGQHLAEREERDGQEPDPAVARVEQHGLVLPHRRDEAAVPALPLAAEGPSRTVQLLATRTVPPTAAMRRPSRNGRVSRSSASGSMRVSASTAMTSGKRLALMAALSESALPPFSLSITVRRVRVRDRYTARWGALGIVSG